MLSTVIKDNSCEKKKKKKTKRSLWVCPPFRLSVSTDKELLALVGRIIRCEKKCVYFLFMTVTVLLTPPDDHSGGLSSSSPGQICFVRVS